MFEMVKLILHKFAKLAKSAKFAIVAKYFDACESGES